MICSEEYFIGVLKSKLAKIKIGDLKRNRQPRFMNFDFVGQRKKKHTKRRNAWKNIEKPDWFKFCERCDETPVDRQKSMFVYLWQMFCVIHFNIFEWNTSKWLNCQFSSVSFTMQFASLWNISYWIIRLMNVCSDFTAFYCERITAAAIDRWYVKKSSLSRSAEKCVAMPIQIVRMLASGRQKLRFVTFCWEPVWAHDNFNSSPLFAQIQMHALSAFIPKSKWRSESILSLCCE